jgi:hypothetical protein
LGASCMPPCSLSLLFSTNKIFPTSAAGVCMCFHSQSGPKNPEHLKIPACHLCINAFIILAFPLCSLGRSLLFMNLLENN